MEIHSRDRVTDHTREGILEVLPDGSFQVLTSKEVQERQAGAERRSSEAGEAPPLVLPAGYRDRAQSEGGRAGRGAFSRRGFLKTVGFGGAAMAAGQEKSEGILMDPGTPDSEYLALGAQCALKPGRPLYIRGFFEDQGQLNYASAVFLNERWGLTAGHVAWGINPTDSRTNLYTGTNLWIDKGQDLRIVNKVVFPGFAQGDHSKPDLALVEFSESISSFQKAVLGTGLVEGEQLLGAGYGIAGIPGIQLPDSEQYKLRAFRAPSEDYRPPGFLNDAHYSCYFQAGNFFNGRGNPGDSGGPVYNSSGKLVGILVSLTGGVNGLGGYSIFVRLDYPEVKQWIDSVAGTFEQQLPPAPGATYIIEGNQFCVKAPWPEVANLNPPGKWQVQESPDLSAWGTALDFVQEGSFGVVRRPLGQRAYFRLRWKPG